MPSKCSKMPRAPTTARVSALIGRGIEYRVAKIWGVRRQRGFNPGAAARHSLAFVREVEYYSLTFKREVDYYTQHTYTHTLTRQDMYTGDKMVVRKAEEALEKMEMPDLRYCKHVHICFCCGFGDLRYHKYVHICLDCRTSGTANM